MGRKRMLSGFIIMTRKGGRVDSCVFCGLMREEAGKVSFVIFIKAAESRLV